MSAFVEAAREQDACMNCYPMAAMERTMKIQEVILRALAKKITWWQAAEIMGITDRQMRRWHCSFEKEALPLMERFRDLSSLIDRLLESRRR
jgi:hypothetical protein